MIKAVVRLNALTHKLAMRLGWSEVEVEHKDQMLVSFYTKFAKNHVIVSYISFKGEKKY